MAFVISLGRWVIPSGHFIKPSGTSLSLSRPDASTSLTLKYAANRGLYRNAGEISGFTRIDNHQLKPPILPGRRSTAAPSRQRCFNFMLLQSGNHRPLSQIFNFVGSHSRYLQRSTDHPSVPLRFGTFVHAFEQIHRRLAGTNAFRYAHYTGVKGCGLLLLVRRITRSPDPEPGARAINTVRHLPSSSGFGLRRDCYWADLPSQESRSVSSSSAGLVLPGRTVTQNLRPSFRHHSLAESRANATVQQITVGFPLPA